jgi:hypothetical protein
MGRVPARVFVDGGEAAFKLAGGICTITLAVDAACQVVIEFG